ncbi:hypothetical protein SAMN05192533_110192 [Mesobacillus persicus]|uniref:Ferric reductase like transmembrane component n=1 Tax=Mesobacillus persicus TaxID=930146 RepID=A0A1H8F205_9BACI|nr:hypothetical protein [Mesobacillus persicus]SEN25783.1 hypothetical protein SAMN05192533_110192 [Mesobacillus persicus]
MIIKWLAVNILTILAIIIWSQIQGYQSNNIFLGKVIAQVAFVFFLINLNMYFVFLMIRKSKIRDVKIKLARISKKMMKFHVPLAITATTLIICHAVIMFYAQSDLLNYKTVTGVFLFGVLSILLFSGILRRKKATGKRRKFHYTMAFLFFGLILLHIFI